MDYYDNSIKPQTNISTCKECLFIMSRIFFLMWVFISSFIVISIILKIALNKGVLRSYLHLKKPADATYAQIEKIEDTIKNENTFNELIKKWTNYNNTIKFLAFQIAFLLFGSLTAFLFGWIQYIPDTVDDYLIFVLSIIVTVLVSLIVIKFIVYISKKFFSLDIDIFSNKLPLWKSLIGYIILAFLLNIPLISVYLYNMENSWDIGPPRFLSNVIVLTIGFYEYTKLVITFFLPVSANGLDSIEKLFQDMIKEN